jgi:hypothetical protein
VKIEGGGERSREEGMGETLDPFFIISSLGDTKLQNSHGANFLK